MKVGKVIQSISPARRAECLRGQSFLMVELEGQQIVAADLVSAGVGDSVLLTVGTPAARYCMDAPIDAAAVAVLESAE